MIYTNPRKRAVVPGWPCGKFTTTATFEVQADLKFGERVVRQTLHPFTKQPRKPKRGTYAKRARVVDGEDGKQYIVELKHSGYITVMQGTMEYNTETIFETNPRFADLMALFEEPAAEVA